MNAEICRTRILSEEYWDFIVPLEGGKEQFQVPEAQLCAQGPAGDYEIVYLNRSQAEPLSFERFTYNSIPRCFGLLDMAAMNQAGIIQVQNYPTLELMGSNVLIGFVDTGIDYQNSVFRNLDGSTRIVSIWDQTIQSEDIPSQFAYGSVYGREQIDEALQSADPIAVVPSVDTNGHGTFLASLAAGGAAPENQFIGAAPEASIAMVKLKPAKQYLREYYVIPQSAVCYQENDIMLGVQYLMELADDLQLPLVVCIALGSNFGGHNGTTPLSVMLGDYAYLPNKVIVTGVGNEANERHHYLGKLDSMQGEETVEIRVGNGSQGFSMEIWTDIPNLITLSLISPSGEQIPRIPIRQGVSEVFRFLFEQTEVYIEYRLLVERNDSQLIFLRFDRPVEGLWRIIAEPIRLADGVFHIWLPMQDLLSGEVVFLRPEPDTTLLSPSTSEGVMSVAYYNGTENSVDIRSGRGYTRNGRIRPDIAAPGVAVNGVLPGGRFAVRSGSSVSVAIAAGAAALLTEWIYYQTGRRADTVQVKNLFVLGARQRPDMEYPNREWGYGTLDVYNTLQEIRSI